MWGWSGKPNFFEKCKLQINFSIFRNMEFTCLREVQQYSTHDLSSYTASLERIINLKPSMLSDSPIADQVQDLLGSDLQSEKISDLLSSHLQLELRSGKVAQVGQVDLNWGWDRQSCHQPKIVTTPSVACQHNESQTDSTILTNHEALQKQEWDSGLAQYPMFSCNFKILCHSGPIIAISAKKLYFNAWYCVLAKKVKCHERSQVSMILEISNIRTPWFWIIYTPPPPSLD